MPDYSTSEVRSRLEALGRSLAEFPESAQCPWPLARIFNELVKQARREVEDDPVLKSIRFLEEAPGESSPGMSNTLAITVRALIHQVALSVGGGSLAAVDGPGGEAAGDGEAPGRVPRPRQRPTGQRSR